MSHVSVDLDWRVKEYIEKLTPRIRTALQRRLDKLAPQIADVARAKAPKRSGRLLSSIKSNTYTTRTGVWGKVEADVPYAHFTEAGFDGSEAVKSHYRTIKQAFGRPINPTRALISAYSRVVDVSGDAFLRQTLAEAAPTIRAELSSAIDGALKE